MEGNNGLLLSSVDVTVSSTQEGGTSVCGTSTMEEQGSEMTDTPDAQPFVPGSIDTGESCAVAEDNQHALRYLEEYALSVTERMEEQTDQRENSQTTNQPDQQTSGDDSETDDADEPEDREGYIPLGDEAPSNKVTVYFYTKPTQTENATTAELSKAPDNKTDDTNALRRSQRKRRSKKRGYEDDSDDERVLKPGRGEMRDASSNSEQGKPKKQSEGAENSQATVALGLRNEAEGDQEYVCGVCKKVYPTRGQYKTHLRTHSDKKRHQCDFCPKRFRQKCQKDKHERVHTGSKPYQCRHCERAFSESGSRKRHELIHSGQKPYACGHCDRRFIQKGNRDIHEKTHLGSYRPFRCLNENCSDTFASAEELEQHRQGQPQKPYRCHFCCKAFPFNAERKRHERCHTGTRPYTCLYCDRSFTQKGNKDNHEKTHTGDKPHYCRYCSKRFIRRQYLSRHLANKHPLEFAKELTEPAVYAVLGVGSEVGDREGDRLASDLLKAARKVASSSEVAEQIGQVVAEVNQHLAEHQVTVLEQGGVYHQLQVLGHSESSEQGRADSLEGRLVMSRGGSDQSELGEFVLLNPPMTDREIAEVERGIAQQHLRLVQMSDPPGDSAIVQLDADGVDVVTPAKQDAQIVTVTDSQMANENQIVNIGSYQVVMEEPVVTVADEEGGSGEFFGQNGGNGDPVKDDVMSGGKIVEAEHGVIQQECGVGNNLESQV